MQCSAVQCSAVWCSAVYCTGGRSRTRTSTRWPPETPRLGRRRLTRDAGLGGETPDPVRSIARDAARAALRCEARYVCGGVFSTGRTLFLTRPRAAAALGTSGRPRFGAGVRPPVVGYADRGYVSRAAECPPYLRARPECGSSRHTAQREAGTPGEGGDPGPPLRAERLSAQSAKVRLSLFQVSPCRRM